jgi:hypothetical protein
MRNSHALALIALLLFFLLFLLTLGNFNPPAVQAQSEIPNVAVLQSTPTPPVESSEIGSTEGILLMGVVIVLIVTFPLLFRKRNSSP